MSDVTDYGDCEKHAVVMVPAGFCAYCEIEQLTTVAKALEDTLVETTDRMERYKAALVAAKYRLMLSSHPDCMKACELMEQALEGE